MFTTLSTILVPIKTGFTSSSPFEYPRPFIDPDLTPPCPLEGEHEVLFGNAFKLVSVAGSLAVGGPGLTLDAEADLSSISGWFLDGLHLTDGELPRDLIAEDDLILCADVVSKPDMLDGC